MKIRLLGYQITITKITMWTAKITSKEKSENNLGWNVTAEFTNGDKTFTIPFNGISDSSQLDRAMLNQLGQYEKVDAYEPPVGDYTAPVPIPRPEPTQEELDKVEYQKARGELAAMKADLDLKLITQEEYDTKVDEVKALQSK